MAQNQRILVTFTVGDVETPAGELQVTGTPSNKRLVPNESVFLNGGGAGRAVTIVPAQDQSGQTTITVAVADTAGNLTSQTALLNLFLVGRYSVEPWNLFYANADASP